MVKASLEIQQIKEVDSSHALTTLGKIGKWMSAFSVAMGAAGTMTGCSAAVPGGINVLPKTPDEISQPETPDNVSQSEKPGVEQVGIRYEKKVRELEKATPLFESKDTKVFAAKFTDKDNTSRVMVHIESIVREGFKGDTQYIGVFDSFGTQDQSVGGYLSINSMPLESFREAATGSKPVKISANYLIDSVDVQKKGVIFFTSRENIADSMLDLQDRKIIQKLTGGTIFLSMDGSKARNYEVLPDGRVDCERFVKGIDDESSAKKNGATVLEISENESGIYVHPPIEEPQLDEK